MTAIFFVIAFVFALTVCASAATAERVIASESTVWKYLDDGTDHQQGSPTQRRGRHLILTTARGKVPEALLALLKVR